MKFQYDGKQTDHKRKETVKHIETIPEYVFCITDTDNNEEIEFKVGGGITKGVVDLGSKFNLMDQGTWELLKRKAVVVTNQRKETDKIFKAYGEHTLDIVGVFDSIIEVAGIAIVAEFYVIKGTGKFLVGRVTSKALRILQINCNVQQIEESSTIQDEMSKIKDVLLDIPIRPDAKGVIQPYRRVPVALEDAVDKRSTNF